MNYELVDKYAILKVKWRARFKLVLIDSEDLDKVKDIKWTYYNYGDFIGYNVKKASKKRINTIEEHILGNIKHTHSIIHINHNGLDNRKENLRIVSKFEAEEYKKLFTQDSAKLLESYNDIISESKLSQVTIEQNTMEIQEVSNTPITIKKPKIKEINIEGIEIPENLKEYLYYAPEKKDRAEYFYLIGHPLVLEKLNKRRLQGTKSKSLTTQEKLNNLIQKINEL
jgi:hypothetical protein